MHFSILALSANQLASFKSLFSLLRSLIAYMVYFIISSSCCTVSLTHHQCGLTTCPFKAIPLPNDGIPKDRLPCTTGPPQRSHVRILMVQCCFSGTKWSIAISGRWFQCCGLSVYISSNYFFFFSLIEHHCIYLT